MNNPYSKPNKNYIQGWYIPKNKEKYIGNPGKIFYRSSWEKAFCVYLDLSENVKKWSLEAVVIPYQSSDGRVHRYVPDFYAEFIYKNQPDRLDKLVIEIKPKEEITPKFVDKETGKIIPAEKYLKKYTLKELQNYEYSLTTYQKNLYKWTKASDFCEKNGMIFKLMSKEDLQKYKILR